MFRQNRRILPSASDMLSEEQACCRESFYENMGKQGYTDKAQIGSMLREMR
jgi:hypothetical protein